MTHIPILITLVGSRTQTSPIGLNLYPFPKLILGLHTPGFQRPSFPPQAQPPQKPNLESMLEGVHLTQQKQDECIKQLAFKVDLLSTHNKMLETQIAQQASSSITPPGRLPIRGS